MLIFRLLVILISCFIVYSICKAYDLKGVWLAMFIIDLITNYKILITSFNAHLYAFLAISIGILVVIALLQALIAKFAIKNSSSMLGFSLVYAVSMAVVAFGFSYIINFVTSLFH